VALERVMELRVLLLLLRRPLLVCFGGGVDQVRRFMLQTSQLLRRGRGAGLFALERDVGVAWVNTRSTAREHRNSCERQTENELETEYFVWSVGAA
jgi:hypothetical protein